MKTAETVMARETYMGGFTNEANAKYRGLQQHLVYVHDLATDEVSGKTFAALKKLHDHVHAAERGELPLEGVRANG